MKSAYGFLRKFATVNKLHKTHLKVMKKHSEILIEDDEEINETCEQEVRY